VIPQYVAAASRERSRGVTPVGRERWSSICVPVRVRPPLRGSFVQSAFIRNTRMRTLARPCTRARHGSHLCWPKVERLDDEPFGLLIGPQDQREIDPFSLPLHQPLLNVPSQVGMSAAAATAKRTYPAAFGWVGNPRVCAAEGRFPCNLPQTSVLDHDPTVWSSTERHRCG
jgi:hypothetical protein